MSCILGIVRTKKETFMSKSWVVKFALLGFVSMTSVLCANENQNAAEHVIRQAYSSIDRIEEGKIFLKPEKLSLKRGIIYVEDIDGSGVAIPVTFSSIGRPYMQVDESFVFNSWLCNCNTWNHKWDNPRFCRRCGEPR
jgi:hypothetical protein